MKLTCLLVFTVLASCLQTGRTAHLAPLRLTRQTSRYGAPGYRPALGYNLNVRSGVHSTSVKSAPPGGGGRPLGVGGFSFGGMASGRPAYGTDFVVNAGAGALGPRPQAYAVSAGRPQPNAVYRAGGSAGAGSSGGNGGRPVSAFQYS